MHNHPEKRTQRASEYKRTNPLVPNRNGLEPIWQREAADHPKKCSACHKHINIIITKQKSVDNFPLSWPSVEEELHPLVPYLRMSQSASKSFAFGAVLCLATDSATNVCRHERCRTVCFPRRTMIQLSTVLPCGATAKSRCTYARRASPRPCCVSHHLQRHSQGFCPVPFLLVANGSTSVFVFLSCVYRHRRRCSISKRNITCESASATTKGR